MGNNAVLNIDEVQSLLSIAGNVETKTPGISDGKIGVALCPKVVQRHLMHLRRVRMKAKYLIISGV